MSEELVKKDDHNELSEKQEVEQKAIALKDKIDLENPDSIFKFGLEPQDALAATSDDIIKAVKTKDSGELNDDLLALEKIFHESDDDNKSKNFLVRGWHEIRNKLYDKKVEHQNLSATIEDIGQGLIDDRDRLVANNNHLYELYVSSLKQAKALKPYIRAGEMKMDELKNEKLPALKKLADTGDYGAQGDYQNAIFIYHRLSRRVNDLRLAQQANVNLAAQVNTTDIANEAIIEKVNETVGLMVPLWKGNSAVQIMVNQTAQTSKILNRVSDFSNKQIKESSKQIHDLTVQAYKDQEKGVLDLETLKSSSDSIISAIQECRKVAADGEKKRDETAKAINDIANKMQQTLHAASKQLTERKD